MLFFFFFFVIGKANFRCTGREIHTAGIRTNSDPVSGTHLKINKVVVYKEMACQLWGDNWMDKIVDLILLV